jgi:hypothetical protein
MAIARKQIWNFKNYWNQYCTDDRGRTDLYPERRIVAIKKVLGMVVVNQENEYTG